jgi:hypothetical protein
LRNDTVFFGQVHNGRVLQGEFRSKKKEGFYVGSFFDTVRNDSHYEDIYTYGRYWQNKQDGTWYNLNGKGDTFRLIQYYRGVRDGKFFLVARNKDTLRSGLYEGGKLHGRLLRQTTYGMPGEGYHRYELNYSKGLLHGWQRLLIRGNLKEQIHFDHGRIDSVVLSDKILKVNLDPLGNGTMEVHEIQLWPSILGNMYNRDHHFRESGEYFSDDAFNGTIDICGGRFCPEISLTSFLTGKKVRWRFSQDTLIERVYYE